MRGAYAESPGREWRWTLVSGCVTLLLALVAFFLPEIDWAPRGGIGPTRDMVAQFALFLAASFLATGISQLGIALAERGRSKVSESP